MVLLPPVAAAAAAPAWLAPQLAGTGLASGTAVQVATTPPGDLTILTTSGPLVQATDRPAGGPFGSPATLSSAPEVDPASLRLALAPSGAAVAAWLERSPAGSGTWRATAATRTTGGAWAAARELSPDAVTATDVRAGIDDGGAATVTWLRGGAVQTARRPAGGDWGAVETLAAAGASEPRLAVSGDGTAYAIWVTSAALAAARRLPGAGWTTEPALQSGAIKAPAIAAGPGGRAAAVWLRKPDAGFTHAESSARTAGGAWELPFDMGSNSPYGDAPLVTVDGTGAATVAQIPEDFGTVLTAWDPAGGPWHRDTAVDPDVSDAYLGVLAGGPRGDVVLAFRGANAEHGAVPQRIYGAARAGGVASWPLTPLGDAPFGVTPDATFVMPLSGAVDDRGDAVLAGEDSLGRAVLRPYDAAGPDLESVTVPATAAAGASVPFAVTAHDRWSPLGASTWSFGDGSTATGEHVVHAFATVGAFTVTVTARDALGNTTSTSRPVVVTPTGGGGDGSGTSAVGGTGGTGGDTGPGQAPAPGPAVTRTARRTWLRGMLTPAGSRSRIGAVLTAGGYTYPVQGLGPGRLSVTWWATGPRPRTLAAGTRRITGAAPVRLRARLTPAGRRRLRGARSVALTVKATFVPDGGAAVTVSGRVRLRSGA